MCPDTILRVLGTHFDKNSLRCSRGMRRTERSGALISLWEHVAQWIGCWPQDQKVWGSIGSAVKTHLI